MQRKISGILCFLLLLLCLGGCGLAEHTGVKSEEKEYIIYYTNAAGTRLEEKSYTPTADKFDGLLQELLKEYENPPYEEVKCAMPAGVSINGYTMGIDELQVDFNAAYLSLSNVQEVLLRASLVKTLVQLPGVLRLSLTVDGQPLTDDDGKTVEAMDEDTFIDARGEGINSYHYITLNLYFSNKSGDKVVKEMRNVFYSSNMIVEKVIVEQIIRGPVNENLLRVVDPSVKVRNVQIINDICLVDLNDGFQTDPSEGTVDAAACLYAFVNAISDACDVKGVQFEINGESDVRFRNEISLDQVFRRDPDIIEASGISEPLTEVFLDENGAEAAAQQITEAQADSQESAETEPQTEEVSSDDTAEGAQTETSTGAGSADSGTTGNGSGVGIDPALVEDPA